MSILNANRVHEACSATGTASLSLLGALSGKATFTSKIPTGSKVPYVLLDGNGVDYEVGFGTLASATELQRTTVLDSSATEDRVNSESAGTPIKISLSTNQHEVFIAPFHATQFFLDENGAIANPGALRAALFVDTIADMTALAGLSNGETVFVKGSASLGDGLGACYRWDSEDATSESPPETYEHDSDEGLFKKVRFDIQSLVQSGDFEVDAKTADSVGGSLYAFFRKKATAATAWARWHALYGASEAAFKLGIRHLQSSAEKFFIGGVSTGDNFDRAEIYEPVVLPSRTNANGLKARALSWLSGVSRLVMARADAAASASAADTYVVPLVSGGVFFSAIVETTTALRAIDAAAKVVDGDVALVLGLTAAGDVKPFVVKWVAASSATHDGYINFRPTTGDASTGDGRWTRVAANPSQTMSDSDATPSVANGAYFVAGDTDITRFDDMYEGQLFVVTRGDDDIVIEDSADIAIGGADYTLTTRTPRVAFMCINGVAVAIGNIAAARPTYYARAHGIKFDGSDESAAFEALFSAVAAAGGGTIDLDGMVTCDSAMTLSGNYVTIRGQARKAHGLDCSGYTGTGHAITLGGSSLTVEYYLDHCAIIGRIGQKTILTRNVRLLRTHEIYEECDRFLTAGDMSISSPHYQLHLSQSSDSKQRNVLQTGTLTNGSAVVTGLSDTSELKAGQYVSAASNGRAWDAGGGISANTTILTVDSATQITLSQNATTDGAVSLKFHPTLHHIAIENFSGQFEWDSFFCEPQYTPGLDMVYARQNRQTRIDHVIIGAGYGGRARIGFNFKNARVSNFHMSKQFECEHNYLHSVLIETGDEVQSCSTTSGSATVTVADSSVLAVGMSVTGTGIPGSTTISAIASATSITLSANATATGSPSLTFARAASAMGPGHALIAGKHSAFTGNAIKLKSEKTGVEFHSVDIGNCVFPDINTKTPVLIECLAGVIQSFSVHDLLANIDFADTDQAIVDVIGGASSATIQAGGVSGIKGRKAGSNAAAAVVRYRGKMSNVARPTDIAGFNGATALFYDEQLQAAVDHPRAEPPTGRLCLASATPIHTTDQTAKTRVYFTPYQGARTSHYNGSWADYPFAEMYVDLTQAQDGDTTNGSPTVTGLTSTAQLCVGMSVSGTGIAGGTTIAAIVSATSITLSANATADGTDVSLTFAVPADTNADVYQAPNGVGGFQLELDLAGWTNGTTRSGTPPTALNGLYVKSGDSARLYLGSVRTTAVAGQTELSIIPAAGAGGSFPKLYVFNAYNRRRVTAVCRDNTDTYDYTTATIRAKNGSDSNSIAWLVGLTEASHFSARSITVAKNSTGGVRRQNGVGFSNSAFASAGTPGVSAGATGAEVQSIGVLHTVAPNLGLNRVYDLERSDATGTTTWWGDGGDAATRGTSLSLEVEI